MSDKKNIITIDGPAGSGKSTIAKILARELRFNYIDTGAMYRAITLLAIRNGVDPEDEETIVGLAKKSVIKLDSSSADENSYTSINLNNENVTMDIRSAEVGAAVSIVSKLSGVRKHLVEIQRSLTSNGNAILEGRDTGSVVCPNAILKIYLTASLKERIKRRKLQLKGKGQASDDAAIKREIQNRDRIDSTRKDSPLIIPENGVIIDTSKMAIKEVVEKIKNLYNERTDFKNKA
ncbi:MAG: (d)CMP kinase [Actinobacteria bacterium]|nr:(d)CMP kinase [Actinomycetota bacterium]